jgi:hypothetical protein
LPKGIQLNYFTLSNSRQFLLIKAGGGGVAVLGSLRPLEGGDQFTVTRLHVFFPQEMFFSFLANMIFPPCFINKFEQNH